MTVELATLQFEEEAHLYTYEGREVPSVTRIMEEMGEKKAYTGPDFYTLRGKYLHTATEMYDAGTLDTSTVDPAVQPYLDAYCQFKRIEDVSVEAAEVMVHHQSLDYAGRFDRLFILGGRPRMVLADLKTSSSAPWHRLQVAAYLLAYGGDYDGMVLYLRKDGTYKMRFIESVELAALKAKWIEVVGEYHAKDIDLWK
jgi:hypothetical protein